MLFVYNKTKKALKYIMECELHVLEPRRTANVQQQLIKELKVRNKMGAMD
jgi:hypothetical protein